MGDNVLGDWDHLSGHCRRGGIFHVFSQGALHCSLCWLSMSELVCPQVLVLPIDLGLKGCATCSSFCPLKRHWRIQLSGYFLHPFSAISNGGGLISQHVLLGQTTCAWMFPEIRDLVSPRYSHDSGSLFLERAPSQTHPQPQFSCSLTDAAAWFRSPPAYILYVCAGVLT